jgi:hypothetical protein
MLNAFVNFGGIYHSDYHYWHGGTEMARRSILISELLRSNELPEDLRKKVKASAALFASVLMDDDFVPLSNAAGVNLGTPNMPVQQSQYRKVHHPDGPSPTMQDSRMRSRRRFLRALARRLIIRCIMLPHYIAADFPLLVPPGAPCLDLTMCSVEPRLSKFARFYMNLLTPPEVRFGERHHGCVRRFGGGQVTACWLRVWRRGKTLSKELIRAWIENGRPHNFFNGDGC